MKCLELLRGAVAALVLAASATAVSAATVSFDWALNIGGHSVTGRFGGLADNTAGQSIGTFSMTSSTLGGLGALILANAKKNQDFELVGGVIKAGQLKFVGVGDRTVLSPRYDLELSWNKGLISKFNFQSDNGQKNGRITLDFKDAGAVFSVAKPVVPPVFVPIPEPVSDIFPTPLPAGLPLLLAGLGGLALLRRRASKA